MDMEDKQIQDIENIKQEIICILEELYECKFIGKLDVLPLNPEGYTVIIDLYHNTKPIYISGQFPYDKFIKYIREELRTRNLITDQLFGLYKVFL